MNIKTSQTITITKYESQNMNKTMDFIEDLIYEMNKFTTGDNGKLVNENGIIIVDKSDLDKTLNTLNNLLCYLGDINKNKITTILFFGQFDNIYIICIIIVGNAWDGLTTVPRNQNGNAICLNKLEICRANYENRNEKSVQKIGLKNSILNLIFDLDF